MLKLFKYTLGLVVILILTIGFDQIMTKTPFNTPGLKESQQFYVDFRTRFIGLFISDAHKPRNTIENVIEKSTQHAPVTKSQPKRYLYVDDNGVLQFSDSLKDVPSKYQNDAQPLAD
jgi:hypothetical protein